MLVMGPTDKRQHFWGGRAESELLRRADDSRNDRDETKQVSITIALVSICDSVPLQPGAVFVNNFLCKTSTLHIDCEKSMPSSEPKAPEHLVWLPETR